jgi:hypothetical protein
VEVLVVAEMQKWVANMCGKVFPALLVLLVIRPVPLGRRSSAWS